MCFANSERPQMLAHTTISNLSAYFLHFFLEPQMQGYFVNIPVGAGLDNCAF